MLITALVMITCMTGWKLVSNGPITTFEKVSRGKVVNGGSGETTITTPSMISEEPLLSLLCLSQKSALIDAK
ncbi:hypothetical protein AD937_03825 [Gluconobacter japonicus]|nr:hypothetical protein AD937_03825 [Gluconobacter japonicus]KXV28651.1 hypothetical protein AD938_04020 [Gluconobacter japonicus]